MEDNNQTPTPADAPAPTPTPAPAVTPPEPTPTPPMAPSVPPAQPPHVPTGKKKQMMLAIVVVAILLVAGVAYGVYAYVTNTPDYLLNQATEQLGRDANNNAMAAKFKVVSGTESTGTSFSGDVAVRSDANKKDGELLLGLGNGNSRVAVTSRSIQDVLYIKAGSLANLPNLMKTLSPESAATYDTPEMKAALARIDGKWFSLSKEDLQSFGVTVSSLDTAQISPAELQQLLDIYRKHHIFQPDKVYADEKIDNVSTGHFTVKLNKQELIAFLTDLKSANLKSVKKPAKPLMTFRRTPPLRCGLPATARSLSKSA
jgi:hypothetical protein